MLYKKTKTTSCVVYIEETFFTKKGGSFTAKGGVVYGKQKFLFSIHQPLYGAKKTNILRY